MLEEEPVKPTLIRKHFSRSRAFDSFRGEGTPLYSKANSRINILSFLRPRNICGVRKDEGFFCCSRHIQSTTNL